MPSDSPHIPEPHIAIAQEVRAVASPPWQNPWAVFWRRKLVILGVFMLGSLATSWLWRSNPQVYRSSAQLLLIVGARSGEHIEPTSSVDSRTHSHMAQLKSQLVMRRVVKQVFEASYPEDETVVDAHERLKVDYKGKLLNISFAAATPERSQAQLTEIISGYQGYLHFTPQTNHQEAIEQLKQEIQEVETLLTKSEGRRAELLRPTPFAGTKRDLNEQIDERLKRLNENRQKLQIRKAEIERALASQPPSHSSTENVPSLPELKQAAARDVYELELRQRMMSSRARVMRPELLRAAEESAQARELYSTFAPSATLLNELTEVEQSIDALERLLLKEQQLAQQWSETASKSNQLQNTINQQSQTLGTLRRQLQRRTLAKGLETCQLQIIAPAKAGVPQSLKNTLLFHLLPGILGSLLVGVVLGCTLEFADRGFHTPSEIPRTIGAPLVGELPFVATQEALREHSAVGGLVANYKISHSKFADQFRRIRTAMLSQTQPTRGQVLLLASACSGDGQTVCAANLAAAIAQSGRRTLLIDANMRKPRLHEMFDVSNQTGLSDILSHSTPWQKLVQPTLLAEVDLLTSGEPNASPTELLSSPHWAEFLASVSTSYDFLIIDGPAMKESLDLLVLAGSANQILMCLKVGRTSRSDAQLLLEQLGEKARRIVGVVVNNRNNRRRAWHADPWETYQQIHTRNYAPERPADLHQNHASHKQLQPGKRPPDEASKRTIPVAESNLENLAGLLHELDGDARQAAHNSQFRRQPS